MVCFALRCRSLVALAAALFAGGLASGDVLLMHHGGLIEGDPVERRSTADGDEWIVTDGGSQMHIAARRVIGRFDNAAAAYRWLARELERRGATAERRAMLADWCLRHELLDQADREAAGAAAINPGLDSLGSLRRRIAAAQRRLREAPPRRLPPAGGAPGEPRPVVPASFEAPVSQPPRALRQASRDAQPIDPALPPELARHFTRRIQPLLVNNCTKGGCHHQPTDETLPGAFTLDRRLLLGYSDARSTSHNLRQALAAIDEADPAASSLLAAATGPHHGVRPFAGPRHDEWLERLTHWVEAAASARATAPPAEETAGAIEDPAVRPATFETPAEAGPPLATTVETTQREPDAYAPDAYEPLAPGRRVVVGAQLKRVEPRDEFDPVTFNAKRRRPSADAPPTRR